MVLLRRLQVLADGEEIDLGRAQVVHELQHYFLKPFREAGPLGAQLIGDLQELDGTLGLATLCVGGGQGVSTIIERL